MPPQLDALIVNAVQIKFVQKRNFDEGLNKVLNGILIQNVLSET